MIWAYTMIVKGPGNESAIKTKMLELAKNWQLPVTPNK
jgi:hypothetical protein